MRRAWLRTFLIQASWNYDRMVGIGMAFASAPLLRGLPGGVGGERYRQAMARAATYFNAHPYLAGLAIGAEAKAEYDEVPAEQIERLRRALTGPLGSVGDQVIWAGLLPFAAALGLVVAAWVSPLAGVLVFLALYNVGHVLTRGWALAAGWKGGLRVADQLKSPVIRWATRVGGRFAAFAVGVAVPVVVVWLLEEFRGLGFGRVALGVGVVAVVGLVLSRWVWPTLGSLRFGLAVLVLALLAGAL